MQCTKGPSTYLSRQPWGAAQRYHPPRRIPTRVAAPTPGTQHPHGTRMIRASGHNDSRPAMAAVLVRRHHCTTREGGASTPPLPNVCGRHFSGDLRRENYPGEPTQPTKGTYMSRWGLRATAPQDTSTWYNLGAFSLREWRCEVPY